MDNISPIKASDMIRYSYQKKSKLAREWSFADIYYNNVINSVTNFGRDVTKLVDWHVRTDHIENDIPNLMRTYAAWVVNEPFDILVSPEGSKEDILHQVVANTVQDCLNYYITRPKFSADLREIAIRMKLYNAVAQVDYYDSIREMPCSRIIPHTDIYFDPTATAAVNDIGGPRLVAIRLVLSTDEAINRYGRDKVTNMPRGLMDIGLDLNHEQSEKPGYYADMYDVYEFYGCDYTLVPVPEEETRATAEAELASWLNGNYGPVDQDIDHELAIRTGVKLMYSVLGEEKPADTSIETLLSDLANAGLGQFADIFQSWVMEHYDFIENKDYGGSRPKYDDFIYKFDMQYGGNDFLLEPEKLDVPHGQIPVSFYRNHLNTNGLFGAGPFTEVMNLQRRKEKYQDNMLSYLDIASRPPFIIDLDLLHPDYADDQKKNSMIRAFKEGFKTVFIRSSRSAGAKNPEFAKMPPLSADVARLVEYTDYKIAKTIGPTKVMSGEVSGEMSGKAFLAEHQAASRPVSDVTLQIEGPMQEHLQRMSILILNYLPYERIANISSAEGAEAVQVLRDSGEELRCSTIVRFGRGMPTDWESKFAYSQWALERGLTDVATVDKFLNSPIELQTPAPMPAGPGMPGSPAGAAQAGQGAI